nr:MAG TPA: hypothetical protein [Caudoviricetes sp.]
MPIPCTMHGANACHKGNTTHKHTNAQKCIKTKEMLQKHAKIFKGTNQQWRSKNHGSKTRRTQRGPQHSKGSLKVGPTSQNKTESTTKRDAHHTIHVTVATPPPPSGREHPEGLPIPPWLWKTLWITPVTQIAM